MGAGGVVVGAGVGERERVWGGGSRSGGGVGAQGCNGALEASAGCVGVGGVGVDEVGMGGLGVGVG
jgi:hypothetical protein